MNFETIKSELDYHHYTLGRILFYLARRGLRRIDFDQSNAMKIMDFRKGDEEEVLQVFHDVLRFMIDEGIIRVAGYTEYEGGYNFFGVQLTAKGLVLIQAKPDKETPMLEGTISANTSVLSTTTTDASYYSKWGEFAGSLIASMTKSFGSG